MSPQIHAKSKGRLANRRPRDKDPAARRFKRSLRPIVGVAVLAVAVFAAWRMWSIRGGWYAHPTQSPPLEERAESLLADQSSVQDKVAALRAEAFDVAQQLMDRFPDNVDALYVGAATHSRHANQAEAVRLWERCLQLNPRHGDAHFGIGMLAFNAADFATAVDHLEAALATDPGWSDARIALAKALMQQGENRRAVAVLEDQVRLNPRSIEGFFRLGQAWLQLENYEQAKDASLRAIAIDPECRYAYYAAAAASRSWVKMRKPGDFWRNTSTCGPRPRRQAERGIETGTTKRTCVQVWSLSA